MEAVKVLYSVREPLSVRYSALPTPMALGYIQGLRTTPEIGRIMVYIDEMRARGFAKAVAHGWYNDDKYEGDKIEVWRVQCHNLFRQDCLLWPASEPDREVQRKFWDWLGSEEPPYPVPPELGYLFYLQLGIYSTEWVVPLEVLATFDIAENAWL